ncbi:MAG: hypothetical protein LBE33_03085 [Zoogloeaceae bacterium]|jgi:hypothetical protein|nr:hypothetical protein [Zoogloeaceae bacterium]
MTTPPAPSSALPLSASIIVSLAVAATIGIAEAIYMLTVAGGDIGGRLLAVLPIYFIAAFAAALLAFWLLRAVVGRVLRLDMRGHALVTGLTFLAAALLHYSESAGVQRILQERAASPAAQRGSCPPGLACLPLQSAAALGEAAVAERLAAAERGALDAAGFALLLRDLDPAVRAALVRRADLPQELLERIAGDRHPAVREAAAESPRQSDAVLTQLAFDRDEHVRLAVARNAGAPPTALDILASTSSPEARLLVATHPRASEPVLRRLLNGSADRAEQLARERLRGGG